MDFAFITDPLARLDPQTDTSLAFINAALRLGHNAYHVDPGAINLRGADLYLSASPLSLADDVAKLPVAQAPISLPARQCRAIFVRTDPPFNEAYLTVTWLLDYAAQAGVEVINSARGLREANEKLYALRFAQFCPRTAVSAQRAVLLDFLANEPGGQAIAKPIDGHGGFGVVVLRSSDSNLLALIDLLTHEGKRPIIIQQLLNAQNGDKRLFVLDYALVGAVQRVSQGGDHRSNVHVGGRVVRAQPNAFDAQLVAAMAPQLRADGLRFVGLDVIDDHLLEVNVTSPTLAVQLRNLGGPDVAHMLIERLVATPAP